MSSIIKGVFYRNLLSELPDISLFDLNKMYFHMFSHHLWVSVFHDKYNNFHYTYTQHIYLVHLSNQ